MSTSLRMLAAVSLFLSSCAVLPPTQEAPAARPALEISVTPSAMPSIKLPAADQIVFTIPNREPFSGKEGEKRPDWLAWGAETFVVTPNGCFWIADTAVHPNRLLGFSSGGELLREVSLENLVTYVFDLAIAQDSLWILDVSGQPSKIVQLGMDGEFRSSINIPSKMMTAEGIYTSNAVFDLSVGEQGELLLYGVNGYYEMIDAAGTIAARPLDGLEYYGHTYKKGIFNEAAGAIPVYVDGTRLSVTSDFFIEPPFLGFLPDGSFAVAGIVEDARHQIDRQVRYYSPEGKLLGAARQRPQMFYKNWSHHLTMGPDGSVYQLVSRPDHSVQVLRLGFSEELPAPVPPVLTSTPLSALKPSTTAGTQEEQARNALLSFFAALSAGNYGEAAAYYGGGRIEYARERLTGETIGEYWEYLCGFLWCLPVAEITDTEQVAANEFIFYVIFLQADGSRFEVGACCGGDPAASPPVWQFAYPLQKTDGVWKVMRAPLFTP